MEIGARAVTTVPSPAAERIDIEPPIRAIRSRIADIPTPCPLL